MAVHRIGARQRAQQRDRRAACQPAREVADAPELRRALHLVEVTRHVCLPGIGAPRLPWKSSSSARLGPRSGHHSSHGSPALATPRGPESGRPATGTHRRPPPDRSSAWCESAPASLAPWDVGLVRAPHTRAVGPVLRWRARCRCRGRRSRSRACRPVFWSPCRHARSATRRRPPAPGRQGRRRSGAIPT